MKVLYVVSSEEVKGQIMADSAVVETGQIKHCTH